MRDKLTTTWRGQPLLRHVLLGLVGLVVVLVALTAVGEFRAIQLGSMAYLGLAVGGLTVLTGVNGQISLGHGALMAIGAYTTALLLPDRDAGTPLPLVILAAVVVTLAAGSLIGVAAARLHGPYLAGATLALAVAVPGIALYFKERLGGEQGLNVSVPDVPIWLLDALYFITGTDLTRNRYVSLLAWTVLILGFILLANLTSSRVGRRWRAVRDDEVAAELAGIDLGRARISAFMVSAAAAGAAGALLALSVRLTAPSGFTLTLSLTLLAAVVLGGLGSLTGALVGAALLTFLPQVTTQIGTDLGLSGIQAAELAPLVYGLVMMLVILLAPSGLVGTLQLARAKRQAARAGSPSGSSSASSSSDPSGSGATRATPGDPRTPDVSTPVTTTSKGTST